MKEKNMKIGNSFSIRNMKYNVNHRYQHLLFDTRCKLIIILDHAYYI